MWFEGPSFIHSSLTFPTKAKWRMACTSLLIELLYSRASVSIRLDFVRTLSSDKEIEHALGVTWHRSCLCVTGRFNATY